MTLIVAFDPGLITGVATYDVTQKHHVAGELKTSEVMPWLVDILDWCEKGDVHLQIVMERFVITPETAKKSQATWSLEVIGAIKLAAEMRGYTDVTMQSPGDAKRFATNAKLKAIGWRKPTAGGHADDASRHLLLFLIKQGWWDERLASLVG